MIPPASPEVDDGSARAEAFAASANGVAAPPAAEEPGRANPELVANPELESEAEAASGEGGGRIRAAVASGRRGLRAAARGTIIPLLILAGFTLTAATVISPRVIPFNGDEVDTFFTFIPNQVMTPAPPWLMTASYSGMYNLTFWARSLGVRGSDALLDGGLRNRALNLGIAAALLVALYGFGRWLLDSMFGLILMFTAAFAHMSFFIAIEGNYLNETSLGILLSAWAYLAGERSRSQWLKAVLGMLAGAFGLVSGMLYFSGRLIFPALACHAAAMQIQDRTWIRRSAPLLLGLTAVAGPGLCRFVRDQATHPAQAAYRQKGTQILYRHAIDEAMNHYKTDSVAGAVALNVAASFKAYAAGPNTYHAYQTPHGYLDAVSFTLGALGLCWGLLHWRQPAWLLLVILFAINNALLGGLTFIPFPPYHQRVHFGILLGYVFVALPIWALARASGRLRLPGQAVAGTALIGIGLWNCHLYFSRVFDPRDPYMRAQGLVQEISDYVVPLSKDHDLFMVKCGPDPNPDLYHPLYHHNASPLDSGRLIIRVRDFIQYAEPDFTRRLGSKPMVFMFLRGEEPCLMDRVEAGLPGGRWVRFPEEGRPFLDVYLPPREKPAG